VFAAGSTRNKDVVDTLKQVTRNGGANQDLDVERPTPALGNRLRDNLTLVYIGQRIKEEERPQQYAQYRQIISVLYHAIESESSSVPIDQRLNNAAADIENAICESEEIRRRDGWAIDTIPGDVTPLNSAVGANEGTIVIDFEVQYRTTFGDPFTSPHRS
jgi:hypothetical protein